MFDPQCEGLDYKVDIVAQRSDWIHTKVSDQREDRQTVVRYLGGRRVYDYKIGAALHNWNISTLSRRLQLSCLRMSRSQGADNLFCTEKLRINNSVSTSIQSQIISYMLSYIYHCHLICISLVIGLFKLIPYQPMMAFNY